MKLKDLEIGQKFLFINDNYLTDVYVKKGNLNSEFCLVGTPGVYDVFASQLETEVVVE